MTVEIYPEGGKKLKSRESGWRWRVVGGNGQTMAASGQGYSSKYNAKRAARRLYPDTELVEKSE